MKHYDSFCAVCSGDLAFSANHHYGFVPWVVVVWLFLKINTTVGVEILVLIRYILKINTTKGSKC